jgi:L,D-peptidoglycan transpeptidase YkuD (ErfK/YbiS/YcfS/YnhG family)
MRGGPHQVFWAIERRWGSPRSPQGLRYALLACVIASCATTGSRDASGHPEGRTLSRTAVSGPLGSGTTQLLTVISSDWDTFHATLRRYERKPEGDWQEVGGATPVVLGHAGYGWGRGLHGNGAPAGHGGPTKREGDGRSPAGVFKVGPIYGYEPPPPQVSLAYVETTPLLRCVDDPGSLLYNRIVSASYQAKDWRSAELMLREDDHYEIAILVAHNANPAVPGAGSCIFLHVWEGPDVAVRGCTAMAKPVLRTLSQWLEPGAAALVALPKAEYDALTDAWGLPTRR